MQRKKNHRWQNKKFSFIEDEIDRRIQAIHYAIAQKLIKQPDLIAQVRARIEQQKELGQIRYGAYLHWISTLDNFDDHTTFIQGITEFTPQLRKWRRKTPFVGILNEQEREAALRANACGELPSILF